MLQLGSTSKQAAVLPIGMANVEIFLERTNKIVNFFPLLRQISQWQIQ